MQILGHSQISLTLGTYSHVVPELAHEAGERIAGVLWDTADGNTGEMAARLAARTDKKGDGPESSTLLIWENMVRREGLEPPTRGLRDRRRGVRGGPLEYVVAGQSVMLTTATCCKPPRTPAAGHHACLLYTSPSPRDS